ncbi:MAE_28990/MAE_18760 family HEPN-like nuclease [Exiguobacterium sp. s57]|uniref:MAE_28990/MAE_18760 family HEPN-like nuclease n=1 Tax=Exiguobacterium sp. s57 TaxID=2751258 RepID=UPI001BEC5572|nr:MAE_28990/MAE_18760 family HEPN-like nuclease [Exiguobacterium sp. s57]
MIRSDETDSDQIDELFEKAKFLETLVEDLTYDSLLSVIEYYQKMIKMTAQERSSEVYGLMSTYGLLLLNSTYDAAIKEIFNCIFDNSMRHQPTVKLYLSEVLNKNILNNNMTNIKHKKIQDKFTLKQDGKDALLLQSIASINDLIATRNSIAHGLSPSEKGHNDLYQSLWAVLHYLEWYSTQLNSKFQKE